MNMIIKQIGNKFYLYFNRIHPANLCFVGYSIMAAQGKARKLLRCHNCNINNITYILEDNKEGKK